MSLGINWWLLHIHVVSLLPLPLARSGLFCSSELVPRGCPLLCSTSEPCLTAELSCSTSCAVRTTLIYCALASLLTFTFTLPLVLMQMLTLDGLPCRLSWLFEIETLQIGASFCLSGCSALPSYSSSSKACDSAISGMGDCWMAARESTRCMLEISST